MEGEGERHRCEDRLARQQRADSQGTGRLSEQKLCCCRATVRRERGGHDAWSSLRVDLEPPGDDEALRPCPQPRHPPLLWPIAGHRQADRYGASGPESRTVFEEECPDAADGFLERSRVEQAVTGGGSRRPGPGPPFCAPRPPRLAE